MSWTEICVGDIVTTKKGFAFKSSKYVSKGVPVVRVSDYTIDSISADDLKYYPLEEKQNYLDFELHEKDIIVQTVGSWQNNPASVVGKVVRVPYFLEGALLNQNAVRLNPNENVDKNYLFYRLRSEEFKGHILGEARGAANQASITLDTIKSFRCYIPDYETQVRIGNILATYDNLIENNQKQIKLLEEAAQRLYKEWFVDLRFPGYEDVKIVDDVPDGWCKEAIGDTFITVLGGTPSRANASYWDGDISWINSGEVNSLRIVKESEFITELGLKKSSTKLMPKHTTVLAITGATLGQVSYTEIETCANQSVVGIIDENQFYSTYLYLYVSNNIWDMIGKATGGAQQHINKDIVNAYPILLPNKDTVKKLNSIVEPLFSKMADLYFQNMKLVEARDRLLPKLMSGEIEV